MLLLIHGASIEQTQVHFCGRRLDSVYVFLSMSWSETLLTHLNLRPVGGHPRSVVVLPPFEVVLLVDGHQRLMELVVHCLNTDKSTACVGWSVGFHTESPALHHPHLHSVQFQLRVIYKLN